MRSVQVKCCSRGNSIWKLIATVQVYQYLPNGSLEDRLSRYQGTPPLSANMRLKIVMGTAHGIRFLNDKGYVHRDIKTANILLDSEFNAKVG